MTYKFKFPKMDDEFIEAVLDIETEIEEEEFLIEHAVDLDFTTPTLLSHQSHLEALKERLAAYNEERKRRHV